jgi:signal-transduction protein with cAMP-binding, CBS, and nucleotidyltransferase domain
VFKVINKENLEIIEMETIRHILSGKPKFTWSITPEDSVFDALKLMAEKGVGALLVLKKDRLVGILSERDYARKVILQGRSSRDTRVIDIMSSPVHTIHPEQTIIEAMELMTNKHIRHLPVSEDGQNVIGVVSIGDVLNSLIYTQRQLIRALEAEMKHQQEMIIALKENLGYHQ